MAEAKSIESTAQKKKPLDIGGFKNSVWLVKVPVYIAERLSTMKENDTIGSLSISGQKIDMSFKREDGVTRDDFSLQELPTSSESDHLIAFQYEEQTAAYSVVGQITKRSILRPTESRKYKQIVMQRGTQASSHRETQLKSISVLESQPTSQVIDFIPPVTSDQKRKSIENSSSTSTGKSLKLMHMTVDVAKLKSKMFEAFTGNKLQSFKDLVIFCHDIEGAPTTKEKEIKHLLETYARYNIKGANKGFWELKQDYLPKSKTQEQFAADDSANT